ncbi:MAG: recombinase family protein [Caldilinea sp. CFX5]|nr:recombinase family protein [Caldilinea sp. CFX5]
MRYAAYIRTSSEDQIGNFSLDAQQRAIEAWITAQAGILVQVYKDEAQSGRTIDRSAFQQMRKAAAEGKFDAIVVHKFDRFARNRTDAVALKTLLRHDFGVKVFSVSEPSEDSDGPAGALVEGMMESMADWYSKNLADEVAKGKKERSRQGLHNNGAPFGMIKNKDKVLIPHEEEIVGLRLAFTLYATDEYSDNDIALILNEQGYKTKRGRPFSKDTVRDMLQNQIYLGKVSYQACLRTADGARTWTAPVEWFDGQHEAVIDEELFNHCQEVREKRARHHLPTIKYNPYLLRNLVYCYDCCCNRPSTPTFRSYGKMRPQAYDKKGYKCYRCLAHELGYQCKQGLVKTEILDKQVIEVLLQLKPPTHWRQTIAKSISALLGENDVKKRLEDIRSVIKRMDSRWDLGFITDEEEYIQQRMKLQQELENLDPVNTNELERAIDLLDNFTLYWEQCGDDVEAQSKLLKQILERVYVKGKSVVAITLKPNCHLVLGDDRDKSTEYTFDPFL